MSRFFSWILQHGKAILFTTLILSLGGIYLAFRLPIAIFPNISIPRIVVIAENEVEPAEKMLVTVTKPIEEGVGVVPGIRTIKSTTSRGSAEINLNFDWGIDMVQALQLIQSRLSEISSTFPPPTSITARRLFPTIFPIMGFSLTSKTQSLADLTDLATYSLRPQLGRVQGVSEAVVVGGKVREYHIIVDPVKLAAFKMTLDQVVNTLKATNWISSGGLLEENYQLYLVLVSGQVNDSEGIKNLILKVDNKVPIRLRDLATVEPAVRPENVIVTANGTQAVLINIYSQPGGNTVRIADEVKNTLEPLRRQIPPDVVISTFYDQSLLVRESIKNVRDSILLGLCLSTLILVLFLKTWRSTVVAILVIPSTVLITFVLMYVWNMSFNLMTLGGIAAAVGLIIDDAIVVVENIVKHLDDGETRLIAIRNAIIEITPAVISSTLTPIVVFIPLAFLQGLTGAFFKPFSMTMVLALLTSLVLALTLTPTLAALFLSEKSIKKTLDNSWIRRSAIYSRSITAINRLTTSLFSWKKREWIQTIPLSGSMSYKEHRPRRGDDRNSSYQTVGDGSKGGDGSFSTPSTDSGSMDGTGFYDRPVKIDYDQGDNEDSPYMEEDPGHYLDVSQRSCEEGGRLFQSILIGYERAIRWILPRPWIVLVIILILVGGSYLVYGTIESGFMPEMDEGAFVLDYVTPPGTSLEESNRMLKHLEALIQAIPEIESYSRRTGTQLGLAITEPNTGDFLIKLKDRRTRRIEEIMDDLRRQIESSEPAIRVEFIQILQDLIGDLTHSPSPIEVKIFSDDNTVRQEKAREIAQVLESIPGVVDVFDGVVVSGSVISIDIDKERAIRNGLSVEEIATNLNTILTGTLASNLIKGDQEIGLRVMFPMEYRKNLDLLKELTLINSQGISVPLRELADIRVEKGHTELNRDNLRQVTTVTARLSGRDLGSTIRELQSQLHRKVQLPKGVTLEYGGLYRSQQEAFKDLLTVLLTAFLLVFIVLLFEFSTFIPPLSIILTTLLSISGSLGALWFTHTPFNVSSFMGTIMVVGIVAKNGILLLDSAKRYEASHSDILESLILAGRRRIRPIMMTTLAAMLGLLPLALGIGAGAEMQQPLAIAVMGGLCLSMGLSLIIAPAFYVLLSNIF
ncbi:MAG TPA: efflux RND transporter permease subunit [Candidatus Limnocylindrales bacterium]|nr:efflux RND transporter permease subunit [Candidatus Limnocylindrales bacterium]